MALFVVVGILDLVQAYMEPMETTTVNLHASGHTYWPQGCSIYLSSHVEAPGAPSQLSHQLTCIGVMPWPCLLL